MVVIIGIKQAPSDHESNFKKVGSIPCWFNIKNIFEYKMIINRGEGKQLNKIIKTLKLNQTDRNPVLATTKIYYLHVNKMFLVYTSM